MTMWEYRAKVKAPDEMMNDRWQKLATDDDYSVLLTGPTRVYKHDGKLLAVYLPKTYSDERMAEFWDVLYELRKFETGNRGYASGTKALPSFEGSTRQRTVPISSAIIGNFDASPPYNYCRLTAFTRSDFEKYSSLFPMFQDIAGVFEANVGDRYAAQMAYVQRTHPDWVIPGTPFTTITVNVSYPTGYHTDKGDLDEGFSSLTVLRRGDFKGGRLVFPQYGVAVDMQNGDQLLMDAHAAHGNTQLYCGDCGIPMGPGAPMDYSHEKSGCTATRISVVSYYRTLMEQCGSAEEEARKADEWAERRASLSEARTMQEMMVEQMAREAAGG